MTTLARSNVGVGCPHPILWCALGGTVIGDGGGRAGVRFNLTCWELLPRRAPRGRRTRETRDAGSSRGTAHLRPCPLALVSLGTSRHVSRRRARCPGPKPCPQCQMPFRVACREGATTVGLRLQPEQASEGTATTLRGRMVCMFVGHHAKLTGVARFGAGRGAPGRAEKMLTSSIKMFVRCCCSLRRKQLSILRAQDHEISQIVQTAVGWTVHQVYCTTGPRRVNPILAGANSIKIELIGFWQIP